MKKLSLITLIGVLFPLTAFAAGVTKGDVQRLDLDQLTIGGSTLSSTELLYGDTVTAGTVTASKAVVVDSNKDIASFRNLSLTGTLTDTRAPSADSATTNNGAKILFTTPVDTTGTNVHNALDIAPTIGNASGGSNTFTAIKLENVTGDAQVTEYGINIGTGYDTSLNIQTADTFLYGGVTQPVYRVAQDAVASGQTSKAVTVTGVTTASKCTASLNEVATNSISVRAVVPTTDTVTVHVSGDPGASNADLTVICAD